MTAPEGDGTATMRAFGYLFDGYSAGLIEELVTLEKEGAVYSHFADTERGPDEDGDWGFRYYRIPLLPPEIFEYVRGSIAHHRFIKAIDRGRDFDEALDSLGDPEMASRVRDYDEQVGTPDTQGCLASFWPAELEDLLCGGRQERYEELPKLGPARDRYALALQIVNNFPVALGALTDRKYQRPPFEVASEYDVQDLLFALLRPVFSDARREEWTPQLAGSAKRIDMVLPSLGVLIEAKLVRDAGHARRVPDELSIDFECYHGYPKCKYVIALVIDPGRFIKDPEQFEKDLSGFRLKKDHQFEATVLVR